MELSRVEIERSMLIPATCAKCELREEESKQAGVRASGVVAYDIQRTSARLEGC